MKKIVLFITFALIGFSSHAQEGLKVGVNAQLPVGDTANIYSYGLALDVAYMLQVSDSFDAGVSFGFTNLFLKNEYKELGFYNAQFFPMAVSGRFNIIDDFSIGMDLGYALGLDQGNEGGLYYRPILGYNAFNKGQLNLSYSGMSIKDGGFTFSTINLGILISLFCGCS
tara:strand:- start:2819 stop:3325 length:507 start_codon:yes stop_codon:yes gene_type:complete